MHLVDIFPDIIPLSGLFKFNFIDLVLVYALSIPFWVLSTLVKVEGLPDNLPLTDIGAVFAPTIAASILVYREEKPGGVKRLLKRAFDYRRITQKIWYGPIIFLPPLLYLLTYGVMRLIGLPPPPNVGFRILYVWLYNNTGKSIFGIILFHAISNTGRSVFPGGRPYYELADGAVGYSINAITAIIVTVLWGSKTLAGAGSIKLINK